MAAFVVAHAPFFALPQCCKPHPLVEFTGAHRACKAKLDAYNEQRRARVLALRRRTEAGGDVLNDAATPSQSSGAAPSAPAAAFAAAPAPPQPSSPAPSSSSARRRDPSIWALPLHPSHSLRVAAPCAAAAAVAWLDLLATREAAAAPQPRGQRCVAHGGGWEGAFEAAFGGVDTPPAHDARGAVAFAAHAAAVCGCGEP